MKAYGPPTRVVSSAVTVAAFVAAAFGSARSADAGQIELLSDVTRYTMGTVTLPNLGPTSGAGEFGVRAANFSGLVPPPMGANVVGPSSLFQTFCLEQSEAIVTYDNRNLTVDGTPLTQWVYDWTLDTRATAGGRFGAVGGGDPISAQTAYLFTQFWFGALSGFNYTFGSGRIQSSTDLQVAIWYFEDELDSAGGVPPSIATLSIGAQSFINQANNAVSSGAWTGIGQVRVLNLTTFNAQGQVVNAQSMLTLITVPLPEAVWLGLGLMGAVAGAAAVRRRRNQTLV